MAPPSIGRYRILRELGRGATATVYLARDPGSGRQVAVKVLAPSFTAAPDFAGRFEQTLKALAGLEHPYLLTPHDYGRDEEQYFIVMRYLPGGTLADRMDGRPMLLAEVVPLLQRLAEALDAAHTAHLLHGDLHPADVLFDLHERAVLADLGLAQLLDPVAGPSPTGTAAYMSPEQIAGQPIDGRADVYALGIILFEMLTGRQPYAGGTPQELLRQHLEAPVPQLSGAALAAPGAAAGIQPGHRARAGEEPRLSLSHGGRVGRGGADHLLDGAGRLNRGGGTAARATDLGRDASAGCAPGCSAAAPRPANASGGC